MNFKQCCGTLTDLIVSYMHHLEGTISPISVSEGVMVKLENHNRFVINFSILGETDKKKSTLVLKQSMILFTELIENSREGITRLGCACLK